MTRKYRSKIQQKTLLNIIDQAKSLYDSQLLSDFTLKCEETEFAVHKVILAINCPYFRDYLIQEENLFLESMSIDFTTSEVLQIILNYFYSGRISIDQEHTASLLKSIIETCSLLQIPLLSNYCLELLVNKPEREISVSEWKTIEEVDSQVTFNIFLKSILKKLASLNTSASYLELSVNQLKVLFQSPGLEEVDQNTVFQSIFNWIKHDLDGRKDQFTELLETFVDFEKLNIAILSKLQKERWLIKNKYFVKSYFKIASKQMKKEAQESTKKTSLKKENMEEMENNVKVKTANCTQYSSTDNEALFLKKSLPKLKFFVYDIQNRESKFFLYDYLNNKLDLMIAHPLQNKEDSSIVYHEGKIYTFGGTQFLPRKTVNNVYSYNFKTKQWMLKASMLKCRSISTAVVLGDYIYVVGGMVTDSGYRNCVEYFDPALDKWTTVEDLPGNRNQAVSVVVAGNSLYALINSELYKYYELEDEWDLQETELSKYLNRGGVAHMCSDNGKIFIIEKSAPKCVWIYDPRENTVNEDIIPTVLTECDGIMNLGNPNNLEFLVSGNKRWFIYRPLLHSWTPFEPKQLKDIRKLTLLPPFH